MNKIMTTVLTASGLLILWRRRYGPTSLRALANNEGVTTWTAWRRSRLNARRDLGRRA